MKKCFPIQPKLNMPKRNISNLDLKIKLTREYLENGGVEKIPFPDLLEDLLLVQTGIDGKVDPSTVSPRVNAFMLTILANHLTPPYYHPEHISEYQSTLQKSNSFNQENIDTETQFDRIYEEYKTKEETLFRGQREAKWRLYSKLQRQWLNEKLFQTALTYENLLKRMVEAGKRDYGEQIKQILKANHIDAENSISILGYLQHHGCPTPLIDWTYKFQNALFFAVDGLAQSSRTIEIENYCSVYFIEEIHFDGGNMRKIMSDSLTEVGGRILHRMIDYIAKDDDEKRKEMETHFAGKDFINRERIVGSGLVSHMTKVEHLLSFPLLYFSDKDRDADIIFSLNNSQNILNQAGVFTWNADPSKPLEMVGDELNREEYPNEDRRNYNFCSCFNIHKKLESHIRQRLETDGVTREYIYPTPNLSTWEVFEKCKQ